MSDNQDEKQTIETMLGAVGGGNLGLNGVSRPAGLDEQVVGGGLSHEAEDDLSTEVYGGVTFSGDYKLGVNAEYKFYGADKDSDGEGQNAGLMGKKTADDMDGEIKVKAIIDVMYASRFGGIVASAALQAETQLLGGRLKAQGLLGYVDAPRAEDTGVYGQVELDMRLSQDRDCNDFLDKGCLSNVFTTTLSPSGQIHLENQMLHDTSVLGVPFRAGPSIGHDSEGSSVGFAMRAEF
jgi:hypothetical protein